MRICLVADYSEPDEARKVIAHNLHKELSKNHEVLRADIRSISSVDFWKRIREFEPHVIHYIPGASPLSFAITKFMKILSTKPKTIMSSMLNPFHNPFHGFYYLSSYLTKWTIPFTKADLVIAQSEDTEEEFKKLGCNVKFMVCSGVDVKRFVPVSEKRKEELRGKYGIDHEKFVVLHVGSIRKWRNVEILKGLQSYNAGEMQVVVVGRTSTKFEKKVALELEEMGCKIINEYVPKIEEIYTLSDCYVFPTTDPVGSIDIPLSVLEAMATNLPVVSTRFGGLPKILEEEGGLFFVENKEDIYKVMEDIKNGRAGIKTREKILPYSWENIAKRLERIYEEICNRVE